MVDLSTRYLGLALTSPVVASASPLNRHVESVRRLEAAGAGAVVMPSLFEEEILHDEHQLDLALDVGRDHYAEALDYFPSMPEAADAGDHYLHDLERLKAAVGIPVIASLNAASTGGWTRYAKLMEDAGADALELNLYHVAGDPRRTAAEMEATDLAVIGAVRDHLRIPLAIKLSPYYSAMANFASRAAAAGADGLVLFNRFYQPDLDLETLEVVPRVELSRSWELRLPLRWIALLRPQLPDVSLAATTGIATGADVVKALVVGADVAMMTSAVLHNGPEHVGVVELELRRWMEERGYRSVSELRGSASHATSDDPSAFERANYMKTLHSWVTPATLTRPIGTFGSVR